MTEQLKIGHLYPTAVPPGARKASAAAPQASPVKNFGELLREKEVRFSHHAAMRLKQRGIEIQPEQLAKIASAVDKAASKGANDSLVVMNNLAFIVNVKNRTVVTAMDGSQLKDNVFTQIDSAVIVG